MTKIRKPPRWVAAFLRALERCGDVRRSALDAGVDFTTVYVRRKAHTDFAEAWEGALAARLVRIAEEEEAPPPHCMRSPSPANAGADLLVLQPGADGVRAARSGAGRWTAAAEKRFFSALADRANVRSAAAAAGFSTNAIYARRARRPEFRRLWEAAVETGKARLQMLLMDVAERAFDPELLDVSEEAPQVSVSEALNILKAREGKEKELGASGRGWGDSAEPMNEQEADELRAHIAGKLDRLLNQDEDRKIAKGWTRHGEALIPPGWVLDPDYVAPPEEPPNMCEADRLGLTSRPSSA
jgi:hypothetical protein